MNMTIEEIRSYRIAYMRNVGPYGTANVKIMEKLKGWARKNNLLNEESIIFGIPWDNPENTKPENCRYDTCIVIADHYPVHDADIHQGNIVGGKYAVYKIDHTAEAVKKAWTEIFAALSGRGCQFDETRPILERYAVKLVNNHQCEICIPIR